MSAKLHTQCHECSGDLVLDHVKSCIEAGHNVLILMRGIPGSGKSTLASEIKKWTGSVNPEILSTDRLFVDSGGVYRFDQTKLASFHLQTQVQAKLALNGRKTPIIIDNTNVTIDVMQPYAKAAAEKGYEIYAVEPTTPWAKKAGQCAKKTIHGAPKEKIEHMKQQWEKVSLEALLRPHYSIKLKAPLGNANNSKESPLEITGRRANETLEQRFVSPALAVIVDDAEMQLCEGRTISTQCDLETLLLDMACIEHHQETFIVSETERSLRVSLRDPISTQTQTINDNFTSELDALQALFPEVDAKDMADYFQMASSDAVDTLQLMLELGCLLDADGRSQTGQFDALRAARDTSYTKLAVMKQPAPPLSSPFKQSNLEFGHDDFADDALSCGSDTDAAIFGDNDDVELQRECIEVDLGANLVQRLEVLFGRVPRDEFPCTSTRHRAQIPVWMLRQIYNAWRGFPVQDYFQEEYPSLFETFGTGEELTPQQQHWGLENDEAIARHLQNEFEQEQRAISAAQHTKALGRTGFKQAEELDQLHEFFGPRGISKDVIDMAFANSDCNYATAKSILLAHADEIPISVQNAAREAVAESRRYHQGSSTATASAALSKTTPITSVWRQGPSKAVKAAPSAQQAAVLNASATSYKPPPAEFSPRLSHNQNGGGGKRWTPTTNWDPAPLKNADKFHQLQQQAMQKHTEANDIQRSLAQLYAKASALSNRADTSNVMQLEESRRRRARMAELRKEAYDLIYEANEQYGGGAGFLDLHYIQPRHALDYLKERIQGMHTGAVLRVVTGIGHNSTKTPVLTAEICRYLKSNNYRFTRPNPGEVRVTCK